MGISTSCRAARSSTARVVLTPSATEVIFARIRSIPCPSPSRRPTWWLRLSGLAQVAIRSPTPANPPKVRISPPRATPSRVISAKPRVVSAATVFIPNPSPMAAPAAMAITFLTEPATSTPTTSEPAYTLKSGVLSRDCTRRAASGSGSAATVAAGCPFMISADRLGPDNAPMRAGSCPSSTSAFHLDAFGQAYHRRRRRNELPGAFQDGSVAMGGNTHQNRLRTIDGLSDVGGSYQLFRQTHPRQVGRVFMIGVDLRRQLRPPSPEGYGSIGGGQGGYGGAPGARP